jgi:drug/metabolite transporter (DMT)-like permease
MSQALASPTYTAPFAVRFGLILAVAALTAAWYSFNRVATEGGIPYLGVVFWQCCGSAVILGVVLLIRRRRIPFNRRHLIFYAISGLLGAVIPFIGVALAAPEIPVGVLSMGLTLEPGLTYLIALPLLLERFRTFRFAGILLGVGGLMLILLPEAALPSRAMVPWVLVGLALPVDQALWNNYVSFARPPDVGSHVLAFGLVAAAALMLLVPAIATGAIWWFDGPGPNPDLWWPLVALAVTNCGWIVGFEAVRLAGPVFFSMYALIGTPLTVAVGMVAFGERHSLWIWSALILLMASLYLVNRTMASAQRRADNP